LGNVPACPASAVRRLLYPAVAAFASSSAFSRWGGFRPVSRSSAQCSQMTGRSLDSSISAPQYWQFCVLLDSEPNACCLRCASNRFHASSASDRRFEIANCSFVVGRLDRLTCSIRRTYFMIRSQRIDSSTALTLIHLSLCVRLRKVLHESGRNC
jgi:hypothetical protein